LGELAWIYAEMEAGRGEPAILQQFLAEHPANAEAYAAARHGAVII